MMTRVVVEVRDTYISIEDVHQDDLVEHYRRIGADLFALEASEVDFGAVAVSREGFEVNFIETPLPEGPWAVSVESVLARTLFYIFPTFKDAWSLVMLGHTPVRKTPVGAQTPRTRLEMS